MTAALAVKAWNGTEPIDDFYSSAPASFRDSLDALLQVVASRPRGSEGTQYLPEEFLAALG